MIAYKGFESGLVCRGYQFRMGLNVTEKANCRTNGFRCAEDPLDCLTYYGNIVMFQKYGVPSILPMWNLYLPISGECINRHKCAGYKWGCPVPADGFMIAAVLSIRKP